jgi:ubiquinone/menaquinone biosynthesis C-methylase UbiE
MGDLGVNKIRQQYDQTPYPNAPIETSAKEYTHLQLFNSTITCRYVRDRVVTSSDGMHILDIGCGTGLTSLVLAEANPDAKIIGIDISEVSINISRQRLQYHGFSTVEFHVMSLEELPKLGLHFDYINCDEVLYLLSDPVAGLQALKAVLKQDGIIRANLHSFYQRIDFFRAQEMSRLLGLMDGNPGQRECDIIRNVMADLKDTVMLKSSTWIPSVQTNEFMMVNYFLQGDKGFTITQMFELLREAGLEFIGMVDAKSWDITTLLQKPDRQFTISKDLSNFLSDAMPEQKLHLFELLHPFNRLLDFWCGHPGQSPILQPMSDWDRSTWYQTKAWLHPTIKTEKLEARIHEAIAFLRPLTIVDLINSSSLDSIQAAICLKLLWHGAKNVANLVEKWVKIKPTINSFVRASICAKSDLSTVPVQPITAEEAFLEIKQILIELESYRFIMLEPQLE